MFQVKRQKITKRKYRTSYFLLMRLCRKSINDVKSEGLLFRLLQRNMVYHYKLYVRELKDLRILTTIFTTIVLVQKLYFLEKMNSFLLRT